MSFAPVLQSDEFGLGASSDQTSSSSQTDQEADTIVTCRCHALRAEQRRQRKKKWKAKKKATVGVAAAAAGDVATQNRTTSVESATTGDTQTDASDDERRRLTDTSMSELEDTVKLLSFDDVHDEGGAEMNDSLSQESEQN